MINETEPQDLSKKTSQEILAALKTSPSGLSYAEAARRLKIYGRNEFGQKKKASALILFATQFKSPLLLLLIGAALVSGFLGSKLNSIIILVIVAASSIIDFLNTYKSGKAAAKLEEKVHITSGIVREGITTERNIKEVVPGDIFTIEAGDTIPADSILIQSKDIFISEGVLTGESMPVEKDISHSDKSLWMGTSVVSGRGLGVAVRTGLKTRFGSIREKLGEPEEATEFDRDLKAFSFFIFKITIFLVLAIILINLVFERKNPLDIFLFAVAVAVGITPELLPLIITSNLARGALVMSKKGVIVKKLSAIHNLGGVDVICTDKTGTLTEDKIALVKYVDGKGVESDEVFMWGVLGSVHRTGVGNTLDNAIQEFKKIDVSEWTKLDELPFDSERRRDSISVRKGKKVMLIVKGAPEEIFKISNFCGDKKTKLTKKLLAEIESVYTGLSADGFRVLGVAIKDIDGKEIYSKDDEDAMTFMGFLAFLDPPKKSAKSTLELLKEYNVEIKIITGDNYLVTEKIARELDFRIVGRCTGEEVGAMKFDELKKKVEEINVFTRILPEQKELIIKALRENGHVVGYLGDGVNDALPLRAADVGISVNNAVDIAKENADIILLRKGLHEVIEGIIEGRKNFANTFKYLMMVLSSNFGNMFTMPLASFFLPFLPMTPTQILLNNFLYDSSQLTTPMDEVDKEFLKRPKKFDIKFMKKFMIVFGPLSSTFDLLTFLILRSLYLSTAAFQTGWFLESIATQTLVVWVFRTRENVFKSKAHPLVVGSAIGIVLLAWILPFLGAGRFFGFTPLKVGALALIVGVVALYLISAEYMKKYFYKRYGNLIEK